MTDEKKWYTIHTYSGFEEQVKKNIFERAKMKHLEDAIEEIFIPNEKIEEIKKGKKKTVDKNFLPGYVFIKMRLDKETWHLITEVPRVTGFLGRKHEALPVAEEEIEALRSEIKDGKLKTKYLHKFDEGDIVKVKEGPFASFEGVIEEVNEDKGKVRILVSIFGRQTPVELDFEQVEKKVL